jgi:diguanylate cyclase (GGDEF)-like protein/PAS domain S-box-containing protein
MVGPPPPDGSFVAALIAHLDGSLQPLGDAIVEAMPAGLLVLSPALSIVALSDRAAVMVGLGRELVVGADAAAALCGPEGVRAFRAALEPLVAGSLVEVELVLRRGSGEQLLASARCSTVRDGLGAPLLHLVSLEDIGSRIDLELEAERGRSQLENVVNAIPSAVWSYDSAGGEVIISARWTAITGQTPEAWRRDGWTAIVHPQDCARVEAAWGRFAHGAGAWSEQFRILRADTGEERVLVERGMHVVGVDGVACVGITEDVTVRVRAEEAAAARAQELDALIRTMPCAVWRARPDGAITFISDQWTTITGQPTGVALGEGWEAVVHPDDRESLGVAWRAYIAEPTRYAQRWRVLRPDGSYCWLLDVMEPVRDADGAVAYHVGTSVDVTGEELAEQRRRRDAVQQAALVRLGQVALRASLPEARLRREARACVTAGLPGASCRLVSSAGEPTDAAIVVPVGVDVALAVAAADGAPLTAEDEAFVRSVGRLLGVVVERRRAEDALRTMATHDALTGLPNRALLLERLAAAIAAHEADGTGFALLFIDLDNFKMFNDSLGHGLGDELLVVIAEHLAAFVAVEGTLARLGGDEFVLVCEERAHGDDALRFGLEIAASFREPFIVRGEELSITASIGIASPETSGYDATALLRDADAAMYAAKALGRSRCVAFTPAMRRRAVDRLALETDLRRATERGELFLEYQPIVSLVDGVLRGFEALVRWQHPTRGLLSPATFIPIAEETGLIVPIGHWIIEEACRQAARWNARRPSAQPLTLSINVSGWQLSDMSLPGVVAAACRANRLAHGQIALEITETVLFADTETAGRALTNLADLGVQIFLDDFGTGYSSLAYIQTFPLTGLKLDRSFIASITDEARHRGIVRAVTAMATALSLPVVAEGIEHPEQARVLRELGCSYAQGYHFSRPIGAEAALALAESDQLPVAV